MSYCFLIHMQPEHQLAPDSLEINTPGALGSLHPTPVQHGSCVLLLTPGAMLVMGFSSNLKSPHGKVFHGVLWLKAHLYKASLGAIFYTLMPGIIAKSGDITSVLNYFVPLEFSRYLLTHQKVMISKVLTDRGRTKSFWSQTLLYLSQSHISC